MNFFVRCLVYSSLVLMFVSAKPQFSFAEQQAHVDSNRGTSVFREIRVFTRVGANMIGYRTNLPKKNEPSYLVGFGFSPFFTENIGFSLEVDINRRHYKHRTDKSGQEVTRTQTYFDIGLGPVFKFPFLSSRWRLQFSPTIFAATHYDTVYDSDTMGKFYIGVRPLNEILYRVNDWMSVGTAVWSKIGLMDGVKGRGVLNSGEPAQRYFELGFGLSLHFDAMDWE